VGRAASLTVICPPCVRPPRGDRTTSTAAPELLRLSQINRSPIVDRAGETLGRVDDLIARLGDSGYPPVTGLQARVGGRQFFVPISQVAELKPGQVQLTGRTVNLGRFERREGEVLLQQDILDHKLINVEAGRLVRPTDIALANIAGAWRVVGIDTARRGLRQRALRRPSVRPIDPDAVVDWSRIEPFVGHVPSSKLRLPLFRLKRLHPAQIADLVEAASHDEGEEIITAVHADPELEADVFEELDTEHQVEFLRSRSDAQAGEILGSMAPDDAADLIGELEQSRRAAILARLPAPQQAKVRALLAYNPGTAGGLMTPDFLAVEQNNTVEYVLQRAREATFAVSAVYFVDAEGRLVGWGSLQELIREPLAARAQECLEDIPGKVRPDADFTDVALLMADYNLTVAPVVDQDDRLVGVISVDDVLETLIPEDWRRRAEANAG
jgi:CBS domain-containing protein